MKTYSSNVFETVAVNAVAPPKSAVHSRNGAQAENKLFAVAGKTFGGRFCDHKYHMSSSSTLFLRGFAGTNGTDHNTGGVIKHVAR